MCVAKKLRCHDVTCYSVIVFHNNVIVLHNTTSWCGKKAPNSSHCPVKCNSIVHVLVYKVWVFEKQIYNCLRCSNVSHKW